jgi:subtilase family serine protease
MRLLPALCISVLLGSSPAVHAEEAVAPRLVPLSTSTVDGLERAIDHGEVPPTLSMQIGLSFTDQFTSAEKALLAAQGDPHSALYRQFLTPSEWDARFGVPAARYAAARSFALAHGLSVVSETGSRDYLLLAGTAAAVEATFRVHEHSYTFRGVDFVANTSAPLVPQSLGLAGVLGLDSAHHANPSGLRMGKTQQAACSGGTCVGPLDIHDLTSSYHRPQGATGKGQQVAVFGEGEVKSVLADLLLFEKAYKLPAVRSKVVSVGDDFKDNAGSGEWDLDTQSSTGMAPDVSKLVLYFGKDLSDAAINGTYAKWADDPHGPLQANASFGECEPIAGGAATPVVGVPAVGGVGLGTQSIPAFAAQETQLRKARAEGRTLFASAGDQGGACGIGIPNAFENNGVPALNVPAASTNAVGVGGTVLYTNGGPAPQRVLERGLDAGGGGSSPSIHADTYQQGLSSQLPLANCVVTQAGTPDSSGALCRSLPDVSADSGDISVVAGGSGFDIYSGGTATSAAGTSLSSPLTMGMWADIQSAVAPTAHRGLGFANLTIYKLGKSAKTYKTSFFDVTVGTNGQRIATTGYDQNTGLGVIDIAGFVKALAATQVKKTTSAAAGIAPLPHPAPQAAAPRSLPSTGLGLALPLGGVVLLGAVVLLRRRT